MNIVCAVLAAGAARRMGHPKQLLPWFDHGNLVQHAVRCALATRCTKVGVVIGAHAASVQRSLYGRPLDFIRSEWQQGLSASLRAAVLWAQKNRSDALLLTLCDQPLLDLRHLERLLAFSRMGDRIVASRYGGGAAVPAIFPERYFSRLLTLTGDRGAGQLLRHESNILLVDWPEGELDMDTPSDVARFAARAWPTHTTAAARSRRS